MTHAHPQVLTIPPNHLQKASASRALDEQAEGAKALSCEVGAQQPIEGQQNARDDSHLPFCPVAGWPTVEKTAVTRDDLGDDPGWERRIQLNSTLTRSRV